MALDQQRGIVYARPARRRLTSMARIGLATTSTPTRRWRRRGHRSGSAFSGRRYDILDRDFHRRQPGDGEARRQDDSGGRAGDRTHSSFDRATGVAVPLEYRKFRAMSWAKPASHTQPIPTRPAPFSGNRSPRDVDDVDPRSGTRGSRNSRSLSESSRCPPCRPTNVLAGMTGAPRGADRRSSP